MRKKKSRKQQPNIGPYILIGLGTLLILTVALLLLARNNPPGSESQATAPVVTVERVSLDDSKTAFDNQEAVFLDVRDPASYEASHIPGAVNIPLAQLEARASTLDPEDWIITYCT